jgi:hypothetical protein
MNGTPFPLNIQKKKKAIINTGEQRNEDVDLGLGDHMVYTKSRLCRPRSILTTR